MPKAKNAAPQKRLSHEERREIVLDAARQVFMEQGYGGASMRPIAARAGITEAMLYRISPSKQELFEDAVAGPLETAVRHAMDLSLTLADETDLDDIEARCRDGAGKLINAMQEIAPLLMAVLMTDHESGRHFYQHRFEPALDNMIKAVKGSGAFWEGRSTDPEMVVRAVFGMCWFLAIDQRFGSAGQPSAEQLAHSLVSMVFRGVTTS